MDIKKVLDEKLAGNRFISLFDKEKNILRYVNKESGQGVDLDLNVLKPRFENSSSDATEEIAYYIKTSLVASSQSIKLASNLNQIFPVIRSSSFPRENSKGIQFVIKEHTSETSIYYVLDLGKSYQLIDQLLLSEAGLTLERLHEYAMTNLESIKFSYKMDTVAGNQFYFVNQNDGFDASRILMSSFLNEMISEFHGSMVVSIPHQDVLIICDIQNDYGYNVLAEMNMKFFANGYIPITALSFVYEEKELKPIFIMK
ncbi:MAG: hypothetical protein K0R71_936 [Bacillales bacterium]|jgi:uncharacterized protein YtpQ (UPF0354 family)|nr:hypothetical protein [Bacillales bacterium]